MGSWHAHIRRLQLSYSRAASHSTWTALALTVVALAATPGTSWAVEVEAHLVHVRAKGYRSIPGGIDLFGFNRESMGADFAGTQDDPFGGSVRVIGTVSYIFPPSVTGTVTSFPSIGLRDVESFEVGLTISATRTVTSTVPSGDCISVNGARCPAGWQGESRVCQAPTAEGSEDLMIRPTCECDRLSTVGWGFVPPEDEAPEADAIDEAGVHLGLNAGFFGLEIFPIYRIPRVVTSLTRSSAEPGETVRLFLNGSIIADATEVDFGPGTTTQIVEADINRSPFRIEVEVTVSSAAPPGPRRIAVVTPRGEILSEPEAIFTIDGAEAGCEGDCDGDGRVSVSELIRGVNQALMPSTGASCTAFDRNADGRVTITELIAAVNRALQGCA